MKRKAGLVLNKTGFFSFGRNVYYKKGKHTLNLVNFLERLLLTKNYAKDRRHF